jgi:hypothetical protein
MLGVGEATGSIGQDVAPTSFPNTPLMEVHLEERVRQ